MLTDAYAGARTRPASDREYRFWFTGPGEMVPAERRLRHSWSTVGYNVRIVKSRRTSFKESGRYEARPCSQDDGAFWSHIVYGGAVITAIGHGSGELLGLVYVAAHMPNFGRERVRDGKRFRATAPNLAK